MIRQWTRTLAASLLLVLIVLALPAMRASAHALLVETTPAAGEMLAKSPDEIRLVFNEPVRLLALRVQNGDGMDVTPAGAPLSVDATVTLPLGTTLPHGRYLVTWRIGSLDGHVVGGSFDFAVGAVAANLTVPARSESGLSDAVLVGLRAFARAGLLFAVGLTLFRGLLGPPRRIEPVLDRAILWAATGGVLAQLLFVAADGAVRAGLPAWNVIAVDAWRAAFDAGAFPLHGLGFAGLGMVALIRRGWLAAVASIVALATLAGSGHVLSHLPRGAGEALMLTHGLAAALWIGAIAPLRASLKLAPDDETRALFRRFHRLGEIAVATVLASGIAMAWVLLPRFADLWQSDYGQRLLLKLMFVATMLALALVNRFLLTGPALAGGNAMRARLRVVLAIDLVAAAMAALLAAGLSLGPPPQPVQRTDLATAHYAIEAALTPGRAGDNDLDLILTAADGQPQLVEPLEVRVEFVASGDTATSLHRTAARVATGHYRIEGAPLWQAGDWMIALRILVDDFTQERATVAITLKP